MTMRRNVRGNGSSNCCKRFVLTGAEAVARHKRQGRRQRWTEARPGPGAGAGADDKTKIVSFCLQRQRRIAAEDEDEAEEDKRVGSRTAFGREGQSMSCRGGRREQERAPINRKRNRAKRTYSQGSEQCACVSLSVSVCVCVRVWVNVNPLYREQKIQ